MLKTLPDKPLSALDMFNFLSHHSATRHVFDGVYMLDELPNHRIVPTVGEGRKFVLNLGTLKSNGTHWCGVTYTNNIVVYYDPFGLPPPVELVHHLNSRDIWFSVISHQLIADAACFHCGHLTLYHLALKCR